MKQFSLEEYLKNPSRKVVTRDGRNVKIHCTNCVGYHPVIAEIEGEKYSYFYDKNGGYHFRPSINDLFFAPEKREGWVTIYRDRHMNLYTSNPFESEETAIDFGKMQDIYIKTVKIEWEE